MINTYLQANGWGSDCEVEANWKREKKFLWKAKVVPSQTIALTSFVPQKGQ